MDKPTTPDGQNASPWPEESGSEQGFGATGVFQVVQDVKKPEPAAGSQTDPWLEKFRTPEAPKPFPEPAPKPLAEPVVHKVVLGAGAESSPELLDRMRLASAERSPLAETASAPASSGQGSGGFTALLRTLESEQGPPAAAPREMPATTPPAQNSGFTSLLRTLNSPDATATPAEAPTQAVQPALRPIPEEPRQPPAAPSSGGFTALLQTTTGADSEMSGPPMQRPGPGNAPVFGGTAGAIPTPAESKPGAFTQLFGTFGGGEASAPVPAANDRTPGGSSPGSAGSFTRMLSLEPQPPAAEPAFREERKPLPGTVDYGLTPGIAGPAGLAAVSRDPFAPAPVAESKPVDSAPPGGSVGITRLIQMLDEPTKPSAPRMEPAPVSTPRGTEPGVWTQTFASLSTPSAPAAPPAATAPAWPSPPPMPVAPAGREAQFPGRLNEPPVQPSAPAGPSEFTRILDASRIRELAMRGGGTANLPQAPAPPPPPAMPSYPVPAAPPVQGIGGMPHPGVYPPPPPQAPSYPMSYGSPAGAMPSPGGSMPQPGMYAPAPPPMPAAPPAPPAKPAEPGVGKLQQLVPMLLVVIVVLLVVILVTVIFLMKH